MSELSVKDVKETENTKISRYAATQGMVLLENRNQVLPITTKKIALFGGGAYATVKGGTGSGNVSNSYEISINQGFVNAGYTVTSSGWIEKFGSEYDRIQKEDTTLSAIQKFWSGEKIVVPDPEVTEEDIAVASLADTAIYVISRNTGENYDRTTSKGDYYLSDIEKNNLRLMANSFKTSIVVLNTCVMDTKFFNEIDGLDALIVMSQAGMEGGAALVEVLDGTVTPSGKLTDTWANDYNDYPTSESFSENDGNSMQENYEEGIYVGYRYFDSFNITPTYEFGYGLSYTDFSIKVENVNIEGERVKVQAKVTNTGLTYSGKEVVQVYFSAPDGKLDKPYQELVAFGKTDILAPQESQTLEISYPIAQMSSYDETVAAYILEAGDYLIRVGNSSRNTKVSAILRLDEKKITEQLSNQAPLDQDFKDLTSRDATSYSYDAETDEIASAPKIQIKSDSITTKNNASKYNDSSVTTYLPEGSKYESAYKPGSMMALNNYEEKIEYVPSYKNIKLYDVYNGKITMEEFVAQLDIETLATLVNGIGSGSEYSVEVEQPIEGAKKTQGKAAGVTTSNYINSYGIPNTVLADGPAGLHMPPLVSENQSLSVELHEDKTKNEGQAKRQVLKMDNDCTAFPVGTLLAQSWDIDLIKKIGKAFANEMLERNATVVLAPGMNIHRDPLCGRNFEYYSEDPFVTGMAGSMFTLGVQSYPGVGVSIKHFVANNQETNRRCSNSSVSERALRELYLKGFEMVVRSAQPMTVMTSYNKLNGIYCTNRYDLCTHILRGEWGFDGYVMTDWGVLGDDALNMYAGNDVIMGGNPISNIVNAIKAPQPVFNEDGSINITKILRHGGAFTMEIENWNSFKAHADGKDKCTTTVAADIEVSEKVKAMIEENKAKMTINQDGTKTIDYYGINIGSYITLGDLQKSAMNLLKILLKSWNVKYIYNQETGYEPIQVKPYSAEFDDLESYLCVKK